MPSLTDAFPEIETVQVEALIRLGGVLDGRPSRRVLGEGSITLEPVRCTRESCRNGGWDLWEIVRGMAKKRETERKVMLVCQGSERMNRRDSRTCLAHFEADIRIGYR